MNIKSRLRHLAHLSATDRQFGRTTRLAKAALESDGILVTNNFDEATHLQRQHKGLVAKSMDINMQGYKGPFYFDHHAVEQMFLRAANKIEELENKIFEYETKIANAKLALGETK